MEDIVERLRYGANCPVSGDGDNDKLEDADEIESLRAQLANEKSAATEIYQALENMRKQLLATQAQAARVVEAPERLSSAGEECEFNDIVGMCFPLDEWNDFEATLSIPINFDALHEHDARECERLAHLFPRGSMHAHKMLEEAGAHRAKKDSRQ